MLINRVSQIKWVSRFFNQKTCFSAINAVFRSKKPGFSIEKLGFSAKKTSVLIKKLGFSLINHVCFSLKNPVSRSRNTVLRRKTGFFTNKPCFSLKNPISRSKKPGFFCRKTQFFDRETGVFFFARKTRFFDRKNWVYRQKKKKQFLAKNPVYWSKTGFFTGKSCFSFKNRVSWLKTGFFQSKNRVSRQKKLGFQSKNPVFKFWLITWIFDWRETRYFDQKTWFFDQKALWTLLVMQKFRDPI